MTHQDAPDHFTQTCIILALFWLVLSPFLATLLHVSWASVLGAPIALGYGLYAANALLTPLLKKLHL